jgi:hypothetical protein
MKHAITVLLLAPLAALHAAGFIVFDVGVAPAPIIVFSRVGGVMACQAC